MAAEKRVKKYISCYDSLMAEWDWERNDAENIFPDKIPDGSHKKVGGNAMKVIRGKLLLLIELDKGEDAHIVQVNCR